ncbi:hypothetical protein M514_11737 [Trichuris suis]|uniref:Uncharacterized protein n=1 Tax=Trichuris suis TaxID=68888 RepID=A0A085MVZ4_9BILA|nr:hypothetical protein M514_11737 [Trichuris suis]
MEYQDVKDILNYQQDELTTDELQGKQKGEKNQMMMKIRKLLRSMTTAELSDAALETTEQRLQWLEDNGSNAERSRTARRGVRGGLELHKQLLYERKNMCKTKERRILFY